MNWKSIRLPHTCPETGDMFVNYKDIHKYAGYGKLGVPRTDFTDFTLPNVGQIMRDMIGDEPTWQDDEDDIWFDGEE